MKTAPEAQSLVRMTVLIANWKLCCKFTLLFFTAHPAGLSCVGKMGPVGQGVVFTPTWLRLPPLLSGGLRYPFCASDRICLQLALLSPGRNGGAITLLRFELGSNYGRGWIYIQCTEYNLYSSHLSLSSFLNCPFNTPASTFPIFVSL